MSLNDISFVKGEGGLGRPLPGSDFVSGLLFYTANGNLPSGWTTSARVKALFGVEDAENAGILNTHVGETKATVVYTYSAVGSNGDATTLKFTEPEGVVITLGTFMKTAAETTVTLLAAAVKAAINALTDTHGYTADNTAGALTITVREGLGVYPNTATTPLVVTNTGTLAGSITTTPAGGVASLQDVWHYHISEYFRLQPKGKLFVGFYAVPSPYVFTEITYMQQFAAGAIRQVGIYKDGAAYAAADITAMQAIATALDTAKTPLSILYGGNHAATTDLTALVSIATLASPKVSVVIAQDGGALGNTLWYATGKSITVLGALLGAVSLAAVEEDIAWVGKFNISNGTECDTLAFANGLKYSDTTVTPGFLTSLDTKRFIFLRKFSDGVPGSYFNDSHTATLISSDYAYIENNRTIDKALRGIYSTMLPLLNSPLLLNADGTLRDATVTYFETQAEINLIQMERDGELSAHSVSINTTQNVATTSLVILAADLTPYGVARNIRVNIGFKTT
jgi:hypothetical protein